MLKIQLSPLDEKAGKKAEVEQVRLCELEYCPTLVPLPH